ncbi:MAG TPA: carboxypeptidase-like regulatory domain-containing protein, partial [Bryobacteraceae bacterium]|nr:carboxypeptidase-like regulatory domain-containing protein [Bryobacteraceae bacterium]
MPQPARLCAIVLLAAIVVSGQTAGGSLSGTVFDQSAAAVPGATVKLAQQPVGIERTVSTNANGYYTFQALPRGEYTIEIEQSGFATIRRSIALQIQENATLDIELAVGDISTHISVSAEAPVLQTNDAIVGQVINGQQTVELPLNGRQFSQLILLSPGAAPRGGGQQAGFTVQLGGGGISPAINGQSGNQNNFTLDGLDNNSRFANIWAISPPPDAIQEFKVESGQRAGANVNIATRAGTNEFHGSVWEFLRNDKLDARNTFDTRKPPYRQNQYGVYAGGPLFLPKIIDGRKTNSWISGYWEGFRSRRGQTFFATVPTAEMISGDLSRFLGSQTGNVRAGQIYDPFSTTPDPLNPGTYLRQPYPGNIVPSSRISSVATDYLKYFYPTPNQPGFPNNFVSVQSREINSDQGGIRFDQRVGRENSLFVRANVFNGQSVSPSSVPLNAQYLENRTRSIGGSYTHVFNPTLIGTLGVAYTRDFTPNHTPGVPKDLFDRLGL